MYEYLFTMRSEMVTIWKRPWTATSLLLLSTRWLMFLNVVLLLPPNTPKVTYIVHIGAITLLTALAFLDV